MTADQPALRWWGIDWAQGETPSLNADPTTRPERLIAAEAIMTDFIHYPELVVRDACDLILKSPGVDYLVFRRAEFTLEALG